MNSIKSALHGTRGGYVLPHKYLMVWLSLENVPLTTELCVRGVG